MDIFSMLALSPILLVIVLLFVFRRPLVFTAPLVYLFTLALCFFVWKIKMIYATAATLRGFLVSIDITIIIFGAIFFLEFLKNTGIIESIEYYLSRISPDRRIQAIVLAWFMVSFLEGTAGFGTPAAIVAPLLVGIGFPAITAVVLALLGNSTAVVFGAVGTPIRIGFSGLDTASVPFFSGLINLFAGILVPIMIVVVLVLSDKGRKKMDIREMLPFSVWAGFCLTVPYFLLTFVGQEFPSLIAPLIGVAVVVFTTRKGFLVPKKVWNFSHSENKSFSDFRPRGIFETFSPYLFLVVLLVAGKFILGSIPIKVLGVVSHNINFFNPGLIFVVVVFVFMFAYRKHFDVVSKSSVEAVRLLGKPLFVIFFVTAFVQLMIYSSHNYSGLGSMVQLIAGFTTSVALPFFAPFLGAFGAFIAGSATVSNLLFGQFQYASAAQLGIDAAVILSLQVVGAGIGNMVALSNIVAAQSTVGLHGSEREILRKTFIPAIIYTTLVGVIGMLLVYIF